MSIFVFLTTNFNHLSEIQFCMFQIYDIPQSFKIPRILFNQAHVEVGRWRNIKRENRICNLCNGRNLGDEFHYLFECPSLSNERKKYFEPHFINRPNILKFCNPCSKYMTYHNHSKYHEFYLTKHM
jgi:hypothetical protein